MKLAAGSAIGIVGGWIASSAVAAPPNFIVINIDDLGYGDVGRSSVRMFRRRTSTPWPVKASAA